MNTTAQTDRTAQQHRRNRNRALAIGVFSGPSLWGLQILIGYVLVPAACTTGSKVSLYYLAAVTGLLVIVAGAIAWRQWQIATHNHLMDLSEPQADPPFLGSLGVAMSLLFLLIIVGTGLANLILSPCPLITMSVP